MSKGRIIVSTATDGVNKHEEARNHAALLSRQFSKYPNNVVCQAIGMYEGKEELSVIINIPDVPFLVLAASAHAACADYKQKSVYFSHNGNAFLATAGGDMVILGKEYSGEMKGSPAWRGGLSYTRIIGTDYYIWTSK